MEVVGVAGVLGVLRAAGVEVAASVSVPVVIRGGVAEGVAVMVVVVDYD